MLFSLYSIYFCILLYIYIHHGRGSNKKEDKHLSETQTSIYLSLLKPFCDCQHMMMDEAAHGGRKERNDLLTHSPRDKVQLCLFSVLISSECRLIWIKLSARGNTQTPSLLLIGH